MRILSSQLRGKFRVAAEAAFVGHLRHTSVRHCQDKQEVSGLPRVPIEDRRVPTSSFSILLEGRMDMFWNGLG